MRSALRRLVTGHDAAGKAIVLFDGAAPNVKTRPAQGGVVSTLVWVTDESPADISGSRDRAARESGVAPPARGSIFRVVDFPPIAAAPPLSHEAVRKEMGLDQTGAKTGGAARHPLMHRTRSVDYAIVLEGEIDMLLDDAEVRLHAGDVLVQQGTNHAWINRGTRPCRIAFVLVDAEEPPQWK